MNRRLLTLLAALSAGTFLLLAAVFVGTANYASSSSIAKVSREVHATYLNEIIYNYKNELVSGNFRFFRNQIASLMDHEVFSDYAIFQNGREVEASEHFNERIGRNGYLRISVPVWFNEEKTMLWGSVDLIVSEGGGGPLMQALRSGIWRFLTVLFTLSLALAALYFYVWQRLNLGLGKEIERIFTGSPPRKPLLAGLLWKPTLEKLRALKMSRDELAARNAEAERQLTMTEITRQVAHDIRSPLATLNFVSHQLQEVGEEKRLLIRHAVQRITDIAHDLSQRAEAAREPPAGIELTMLSSLVDLVVSEKRVQHREKIETRIEAELAKGYGLFASLLAADIRRALSNLIDNAVEALPHSRGLVSVRLFAEGGHVHILVEDNGRGIPTPLLATLGRKGVSHGKSGSGLGLYQAKNAVTASSGEFQLTSTEGSGTRVKMSFESAPVPKWFLGTISIPQDSMIITIDDDVAIHALWKDRISDRRLAQFSSLAKLEEWLQSEEGKAGRRLFLFDYEFHGANESGLDVIDRLGIGPESVLITSRFEDPPIQQRCGRMGVKMVPKGLASLVPMSFQLG